VEWIIKTSAEYSFKRSRQKAGFFIWHLSAHRFIILFPERRISEYIGNSQKLFFNQNQLL